MRALCKCWIQTASYTFVFYRIVCAFNWAITNSLSTAFYFNLLTSKGAAPAASLCMFMSTYLSCLLAVYKLGCLWENIECVWVESNLLILPASSQWMHSFSYSQLFHDIEHPFTYIEEVSDFTLATPVCICFFQRSIRACLDSVFIAASIPQAALPGSILLLLSDSWGWGVRCSELK